MGAADNTVCSACICNLQLHNLCPAETLAACLWKCRCTSSSARASRTSALLTRCPASLAAPESWRSLGNKSHQHSVTTCFQTGVTLNPIVPEHDDGAAACALKRIQSLLSQLQYIPDNDCIVFACRLAPAAACILILYHNTLHTYTIP